MVYRLRIGYLKRRLRPRLHLDTAARSQRMNTSERIRSWLESMFGESHTRPANYEPHIDGIRCIAVLSVLFYHFEYKAIPGGFVGVDVFFVISGFLITRLLLKDVKQETFSFKRFYMRRIRRLAPALLATLVVTFIVASVFLTPSHFQRFSGASLASLFSVSNIFFWSEAGYFDATAELKPLLHTWSLSVEEQFYLVWPALLFFMRARSARIIAIVFALLFVVSLVAARIGTAHIPSATFFLMPFRVYEFAIGALLALIPLARLRGRSWNEIFVAVGLVLLWLSFTQFDKSTAFPDINALLPCIAAALLIAFGTSPILGLLLRNPLSVFVGKISYSLYLVHWPVVVLYKHISFEDVVVGKTRLALLMLTFLLAIALHYLIENRFRTPAPKAQPGGYKRVALWLSAPLLVVISSVHAFSTDGWSARFDKEVIAAIGNVDAKQLLRREFIEEADSTSNLAFDEGRMVRLLVMGDSHATDGFNALYLANPIPQTVSVRRLEIDDVCLYLFVDAGVSTEPETVQKRCRDHFAYLKASPLLDVATHVVLSTRWEQSSFEYLPAFSDYLQSRNNTVIAMGRTGEYKNVPSLVLKNGLGPETPALLAQDRDTSLDALNDTLRTLSESLDLLYVDKVPYLCSDDRTYCDVVDESGKILYTDYGHWSMEGARLFGTRIWNDQSFVGLLVGDS